MWFIGLGLAISAVGWGFLILGVATEANSSLFARPDTTAHTIAVVSNIIYLGYAFCLFGAIWEIPKRLSKGPIILPEAVVEATPEIVPPQTSVTAAATQPLDWSHVEAEFKKTFGILVRVDPSGRVTLLKGRGKLDFESVETAWNYCLEHLYKPNDVQRS